MVDLFGVLEFPLLFGESLLDVFLHPLDVGYILIELGLDRMDFLVFPLLIVVFLSNPFELWIYFAHVAVLAVELEKTLIFA